MLELLSRAVHGLDVRTGGQAAVIDRGYRTVGPLTSEFSKGNATAQWVVLPADTVYDVARGRRSEIGRGDG